MGSTPLTFYCALFFMQYASCYELNSEFMCTKLSLAACKDYFGSYFVKKMQALSTPTVKYIMGQYVPISEALARGITDHDESAYEMRVFNDDLKARLWKTDITNTSYDHDDDDDDDKTIFNEMDQKLADLKKKFSMEDKQHYLANLMVAEGMRYRMEQAKNRLIEETAKLLHALFDGLRPSDIEAYAEYQHLKEALQQFKEQENPAKDESFKVIKEILDDKFDLPANIILELF